MNTNDKYAQPQGKHTFDHAQLQPKDEDGNGQRTKQGHTGVQTL